MYETQGWHIDIDESTLFIDIPQQGNSFMKKTYKYDILGLMNYH